ncbi:MAG: hypothetical protein RL104_680 [Bacteroidota bacterium]
MNLNLSPAAAIVQIFEALGLEEHQGLAAAVSRSAAQNDGPRHGFNGFDFVRNRLKGNVNRPRYVASGEFAFASDVDEGGVGVVDRFVEGHVLIF